MIPMRHKPLRLSLACAFLLALCPAVALGQFGSSSASRPAIGELYHVEFAGGFWFPAPSLTIAVESVDLPGTVIDGVEDLGFTRTRFYELRLVVRPAKKHKFLVNRLPMPYSAEAVLRRQITFQGVVYEIGIPVKSELRWESLRFAYEYDFIYRNRGFLGFIVGADLLEVSASIDAPLVGGSIHEKKTVPLVGAIARVYPLSNVSITGKVVGFKLPESLDSQRRYSLRTLDVDIYGTLNFSDNFGVQGGYRVFNLRFRVKEDTGDFQVKGFYVNGVARF
jgi:hypothetical protein